MRNGCSFGKSQPPLTESHDVILITFALPLHVGFLEPMSRDLNQERGGKNGFLEEKKDQKMNSHFPWVF